MLKTLAIIYLAFHVIGYCISNLFFIFIISLLIYLVHAENKEAKRLNDKF